MHAPTPTPPEEPAWLHPHVHEPNPAPPSADTAFILARPDGTTATIRVAELAALPQQSVDECYIVSTGHGTSGPFRFTGVTLGNLLAAYGVTSWHNADIVSADGFGTRIHFHELQDTGLQDIGVQDAKTHQAAARPVLLALACNGVDLTREQGLVRLIVPQETDDALRQVKWVARIETH